MNLLNSVSCLINRRSHLGHNRVRDAFQSLSVHLVFCCILLSFSLFKVRLSLFIDNILLKLKRTELTRKGELLAALSCFLNTIYLTLNITLFTLIYLYTAIQKFGIRKKSLLLPKAAFI